MALTIEEEKFVQDQKTIFELEQDIQVKQEEKATAVSAKEQELIDLKAQYDTDIQTLQTQIDNIKGGT
jgi:hypothetical protein